MLLKVLLLITISTFIETALVPVAYNFGYEVKSSLDGHSRQESRDADGKVIGSYALKDADGRERKVTYTADKLGFKAKVVTNEHGTLSKNPADIHFLSSQSELLPEKIETHQNLHSAPILHTIPIYQPNFFTHRLAFAPSLTVPVPFPNPHFVLINKPYSYESTVHHFPAPSSAALASPSVRTDFLTRDYKPTFSSKSAPVSFTSEVKHERKQTPTFYATSLTPSTHTSRSHSITTFKKKLDEPILNHSEFTVPNDQSSIISRSPTYTTNSHSTINFESNIDHSFKPDKTSNI